MCWFCGTLQLAPTTHEWQCLHCEQFNGFSADGDYLSDHPEMWDEARNPQPYPRGCTQPPLSSKLSFSHHDTSSLLHTAEDENESVKKKNGKSVIFQADDSSSLLCMYCAPRQSKYLSSLESLHRFIDPDEPCYTEARRDFERSFELCGVCAERVKNVIEEKDRRVRVYAEMAGIENSKIRSDVTLSLIDELDPISEELPTLLRIPNMTYSRPSSESNGTLSSSSENQKKMDLKEASKEKVMRNAAHSRDVPHLFSFSAAILLFSPICFYIYYSGCLQGGLETIFLNLLNFLHFSNSHIVMHWVLVVDFSLVLLTLQCVATLFQSVVVVFLFLASLFLDKISSHTSELFPFLLILRSLLQFIKYFAITYYLSHTLFTFFYSPSLEDTQPSSTSPPSSDCPSHSKDDPSYWKEYRKINPTVIPLSRTPLRAPSPYPSLSPFKHMQAPLSNLPSDVKPRELGGFVEKKLNELHI